MVESEKDSFLTDIGTGMVVVDRDDDGLNDDALLAKLEEFERVRNRGAVEARTKWIG